MAKGNLRQKNNYNSKALDGAVINGYFLPYKKTYKEVAIHKINLILNIILIFLIIFSATSYYFIMSNEVHLNKLRKETLLLNDENLELQNHLDYLKSYNNVDKKMKINNIVKKAEEVVEVSAPIPVEKKSKHPILDKFFAQNQKNLSFSWSLGY